MLKSGAMLFRDDASLHTAGCTQALLEHSHRDSFDHPPYRPDLAPSDYHLATYLKNWFRSRRFNEKLMEGVKT
jgi:histone-lysine N-methyltransferase SETMAR